ACIDNGGYSSLQRHIGRNAQWKGVHPCFRSEPVKRRPPVGDMEVDVDEPRSDIELGHVHDFSSLIGRNVFFNGGNLALENSDVAPIVDVIGGIDDVAALQQ